MNIPQLIQDDAYLKPFRATIDHRINKIQAKEKELIAENGKLTNFADGFLYYGLHRTKNVWIFREYAPNATRIYLIGEFNQWKEDDNYLLKAIEHGNWEISLAEHQIAHGQHYKLSIHWDGGHAFRIPSYCNRAIQDENSKVFNAQAWCPDESYKWKNPKPTIHPKTPLIYEVHIGMSSEELKVCSFNEFRINVLPRIIELGYNTIQMMAIMEHPYYGSFGYHVSNFFALSSRFGTPEELKQLIDEAHTNGITVIMDIVHSHSVKNVEEGLGLFDGTPNLYFHNNERREHVAWDSLCFDYGKNHVLHFLLSNCKYWMEEYNFDGFRFDGITSMLYYNHGLGKDFTNYSMYYDGSQDEDAIVYLTLANKLIHEINPKAITIAEDMSGMPGLAYPITKGGYGFDYRMAMGVPDYWIKIIKEREDRDWDVGEIFYQCTSKRFEEKVISYAESHDQALVGDKTIIFRLIDKEMYTHMDLNSKSHIVDRGIALHKMIRLITCATSGGGYLTFMGNEFGHPEWIDFPREGNNWSYHHARRQWSIADAVNLKYHFLKEFDKEMINLLTKESCLDTLTIHKINENIPWQIIAFERNDLLFIFNFNAHESFTDYSISVASGKYELVLSSDDSAFGGFDRVSKNQTYFSMPITKPIVSSAHHIQLYLPTRTALVLKRNKPKSIY